MTLENHPIANIFPMMSEEEHKRLKASISEHGLMEAIMLYEGKILDGRNRYAACQELGIEVFHGEFIEEEMGMTPVQFVLATNRDRRQLSPSQLSMVGAKLREFYDTEAKERRVRKPVDSVVENLPQQNGKARDKAGKAVGVSGKSIDHATKVMKKGTPELQAATESNQIAVSKAAKIADLPPEDQNKVVSGEMKLPSSKPKQSAPKPSEPPQAKPSKKQASGFGSLLQEAIDESRLLPFCNDTFQQMADAIVATGNPSFEQAFADQIGRLDDLFSSRLAKDN